MLRPVSVSLALHTKRQAQIENAFVDEDVSPGLRRQCLDLRVQYPAPRTLHRPTRPGERYNCHGLTFASRRTRIWNSQEVQKILTDDGYQMVENRRDVLPGDVVIYWSKDWQAEHSGIVVECGLEPTFIHKVLSKYGSCHEMVHFVNDCSYPKDNIRFYRVDPDAH